jgi:hypothetical protein
MKRRALPPPVAPAAYRIRVLGSVGPGWASWFNGLAVAETLALGEPAETNLTGTVPDQAALRGILNKLWDLNLTLLAVERLAAPGPAAPMESELTHERHA